ncbi:MAG: 50S ribosomal protein L11 methyltransferase [Alphaproteobacteria bacterium]|nr:50S ribosomal protein L11 methyltransferase [Alphaproteobacteria bacterium]
MRAGTLWRVSVDVADAEGAEAALTALDGVCSAVSAFEQLAGGWRVEGLALTPPERGAIEARLALAWSGRGEAPAVTAERLPARDWLGENQASFTPFCVGRFFVHGGNFAGHVPAGTIPLLIDAATAFGTGEHGSTKGCLLALSRLARPRRILDMGTGTGILAIAAAKRYRRCVLAADIDAEAVRVAGVNAGRNGAGGRVRPVCAGSYRQRTLARGAPFDLVLANILARPLALLAHDLGRVLAARGVAVLAGLLPRQEGLVLTAHRAAGLHLAARIDVGGWRTLILARGRRVPANFPILQPS